MDVLIGGTFITAFALLAGANNFEIGLLAALSPVSQLLQLPAVSLVNKLGRRKLVTVTSSLLSRGFLLPVALLPFVLPLNWTLWPIMFCLLAYYSMAAISGCSFNSWIRDLVPERLMGRFFSIRTAFAIGTGAIVSLIASGAVDAWNWVSTDDMHYLGYCVMFLVAIVFGFISVYTILIMPEPRIHRRRSESFWKMIQNPLRDKQFRPALIFLGAWTLAINIPGPFYTVYMLQRLDMPLFLVIGVGLFGQFANVLSLPTWGRLADRFGNRAVMVVAAQIFTLSLILWPMTTMPNAWWGTWPLLIAINLLMGAGGAGMSLCMNNMALALSPKNRATEYMATSELSMGVAGFFGPLIGGALAVGFASVHLDLNVVIKLSADGHAVSEPAFSAHGLDLLFLLAVVLCLGSLFLLLRLRRPDDARQAEVFEAFRHGMTQTVAELPDQTSRAIVQARELIGEQTAGMITGSSVGSDATKQRGLKNRVGTGLQMSAMLSSLGGVNLNVTPRVRRIGQRARRRGWPLFVYLLTGVEEREQFKDKNH